MQIWANFFVFVAQEIQEMLLSARVLYSTLFFVLASLLVILSKPNFVFTPDGQLRAFGLGPGATVFPLGVLVAVMAMLSFYVFAVIDLVFGAR